MLQKLFYKVFNIYLKPDIPDVLKVCEILIWLPIDRLPQFAKPAPAPACEARFLLSYTFQPKCTYTPLSLHHPKVDRKKMSQALSPLMPRMCMM